MKRVLLFASECQSTIELVQSFVSSNYQVRILTQYAFKNKNIFVGASPMQVTISITNASNNYNWLHEISKHDIIINTLSCDAFCTPNKTTVFANFVHHFATATKNSGKIVIYISQHHIPQSAQDAESAMLQANPEIFFAKTGLILNNKSNFLLSILNSSIITLSRKILNTKVPITPNVDISTYITSVINGNYTGKKVILFSEKFSFAEIISIAKKYNPNVKIIKIPHFFLIFLLFVMKLLPKGFIPAYLYSKNIKHIASCTPFPNFTVYPRHTILSRMIEIQSKNIFRPEIE